MFSDSFTYFTKIEFINWMKLKIELRFILTKLQASKHSPSTQMVLRKNIKLSKCCCELMKKKHLPFLITISSFIWHTNYLDILAILRLVIPANDGQKRHRSIEDRSILWDVNKLVTRSSKPKNPHYRAVWATVHPKCAERTALELVI